MRARKRNSFWGIGLDKRQARRKRRRATPGIQRVYWRGERRLVLTGPIRGVGWEIEESWTGGRVRLHYCRTRRAATRIIDWKEDA